MNPDDVRSGAGGARLVLAAAAILGLVLAPVALAGPAGGPDGPEATASAGVKKQVKKLKKKVNALEQQVSGPAGGGLTGNYPNPAIAPNAVTSSNVVPNSLVGADINEATLSFGLEVTGGVSPLNSSSPKSATANCPPGKRVVNRTAGITGGTTGTAPNQTTQVALRSFGGSATSVSGTAAETTATGASWLVGVAALCGRIAG